MSLPVTATVSPTVRPFLLHTLAPKGAAQLTRLSQDAFSSLPPEMLHKIWRNPELKISPSATPINTTLLSYARQAACELLWHGLAPPRALMSSATPSPLVQTVISWSTQISL